MGLSDLRRLDGDFRGSSLSLLQAAGLALIQNPAPARPHDRPLLGILFRLAATLCFSLMFACIRELGPAFPTGEAVFFRSAFGLIPVVTAALIAGGTALLKTQRLASHAYRSLSGTASIFCNFAAFTLLPMADATALGFAAPLFVVILAAMTLKEHVHVWRWSAVALGFAGVLVMIGPHLGMGRANAWGSLLALAGAGFTAFSIIFLRRMSSHEHSITIAFYYSLVSAAAGLLTLPFGWDQPSTHETLLLAGSGLFAGFAQLAISYAYRYGEASVLAPFDYTSMIWAVLLGFLLFGELPDAAVWVGAPIVIAAGLVIFWRERRRP